MTKQSFEGIVQAMKENLDKQYGRDNMQSLLLVWVLAQHELKPCLNVELGVEAYLENMRENNKED